MPTEDGSSGPARRQVSMYRKISAHNVALALVGNTRYMHTNSFTVTWGMLMLVASCFGVMLQHQSNGPPCPTAHRRMDSVRPKSTLGVPNFGTSVYLSVKTVTICVPVHAPGQEKPANVSAARMRALGGGRDILNWVCVRGIQPHVWCVLARTILVARRLRVGRADPAEGRCLAAMAQTASFLSRNRDRCCVICALRLYRNWVLIRMGKT